MQIAYVEDETDIRDLTRLALGPLGGFEVRAYSCGVEALTRIPQGPRPDVFLLDVMMPYIDGRALLKALRKIPPLEDVPVIFMTAKSMPCEIDELRALGAIAVIPKPFDPMTLADEIKEHLRGSAG